VSLFKENLKLRREEGGVVSRARKVTLDTALPHRLPNQAQPSAAAPGGGLSNQAVMSEDHDKAYHQLLLL
jgi:hypothetical protein